tara:strand:- start:220 stop:594 length:375 start_codon:yes stop_codon:yes gene_type:complete
MHGYLPFESDLDSVVIGKDTRQNVIDLLGSPSGQNLLEDGSIFYISTKIKNYLFYNPEIVKRELLLVTFNNIDLVENIEEFSLEDGRIIPISQRVTTSGVRGPKILAQLFGNIGNFDASKLLDD